MVERPAGTRQARMSSLEKQLRPRGLRKSVANRLLKLDTEPVDAGDAAMHPVDRAHGSIVILRRAARQSLKGFASGNSRQFDVHSDPRARKHP